MQSDPVVQGFAEYLAEDSKRPKTVQSYTGDVAGFLAHLRRMGADFGGDMKRFHVTSYRNRLVEGGHKAATVNKKINSLVAFNRYLVGRGLTAETVVDMRKGRVRVAAGSERQVEVYSEEQLARLLFHVGGGGASAEDRAIILTLLYTGVRVSELCGIRVRDVDLLTGLVGITGKGGKFREVPLRPEAAEAVREYLAERATAAVMATGITAITATATTAITEIMETAITATTGTTRAMTRTPCSRTRPSR